MNRKENGGDKSTEYGGGGVKCCLGQKVTKTCKFVGGRIIVQQEKISRAEGSWMIQLNALQEAIRYSILKF